MIACILLFLLGLGMGSIIGWFRVFAAVEESETLNKITIDDLKAEIMYLRKIIQDG